MISVELIEVINSTTRPHRGIFGGSFQIYFWVCLLTLYDVSLMSTKEYLV
jgi:hypothetical protein